MSTDCEGRQMRAWINLVESTRPFERFRKNDSWYTDEKLKYTFPELNHDSPGNEDWDDLFSDIHMQHRGSDGYNEFARDRILDIAQHYFNKRVTDYRITKMEIITKTDDPKYGKWSVVDEFYWKVEKNLVEAVDPEWEEYVRPKATVDPNRWYTQSDLFFGPDGKDAPWLDEDKFTEFGERLDDDDDYVMFQLHPEEYDPEDFEIAGQSEEAIAAGFSPQKHITFDILLGYVQDWFQEYRIWTDEAVWLVDMKNVDYEWYFKLGAHEDPDEY